jgi:serine/threonine protein kinase/Flp pilus assembly protein TadD
MSLDFAKLRSIFQQAVERPPAEWPTVLEAACAGDAELRRGVEQLLEAHAHGGSVLDQGPLATTGMVPEREGTQIGPYKLLQQIGEGGFGVVFMAEQHEPVKRRVALKIIKPGMDTQQVIARFEAERQALSLMDHPNIAKVLDAGTTESGRPFFVMELVRGVPITQYCDEHHLTPRQRLELLVPVCQAIQHAHQKGIIHRDIKPTNILVAEYDEKAVPKVIDFGVAKAIGSPLTEKTMFTGFGQLVGTLEYMSPEQAKVNQLDIDTRSDIYSLGVLLYELLTGSTPLDKRRLRSAAWDEMLRIIREEEPEKPSTRLSESRSRLPGGILAPPSSAASGSARQTEPTLASIAALRNTEPARLSKLVRGELDWIVMKALEKDRSRRYETASALAMDVQHYLADEPVQACPPSAAYRLRKFARRNKGGLAVTALSLLFLVLLGSGVGWAVRDRAAQRAEFERDRTERQQRLTLQVDLILADVDRLLGEQKWPEALVVVRQAEAALAGGEAAADLEAKVRKRVSDLELVERLEELRLTKDPLANIAIGTEAGPEAADRRYAEVLRQQGLDLDTVSVKEATGWLQARVSVLPALIAALDDWAERIRPHILRANWSARANALTELAQAVDVDPWRRRVRHAVATGDFTILEALARSEEVGRQAPSTVVMLARALKQDQALEVLGVALREHPEDFWLHVHTAIRQPPDRYDLKVRHYTAALALRPHNHFVLTHLARTLHEQGKSNGDQGKLDEAAACWRKRIEFGPHSPHILSALYYELGLVLTSRGKLDEAAAAYRKAIEADPYLASCSYLNLGIVLDDLGRVNEAIDCWRKAIESSERVSKEPYYIGNIRIHGQARVEALRSSKAHYNIGNALINQDKLDEAATYLRKATELNPKYSAPHNSLGVVLSRQGKVDEAIACYRKAIELNKNSHAHFNLGNALAGQEKWDEALAAYREYVAVAPDDPAALNTLAWYLATTSDVKFRNPKEAVELARRAVELDPDPKNWNNWNTLMVAAYRAGLWEEALSACEESIRRKDKGSARCWNGLGMAMIRWQLGEKEEARKAYDRVAEESEKYSWLREFRQEAAETLGIEPTKSTND